MPTFRTHRGTRPITPAVLALCLASTAALAQPLTTPPAPATPATAPAAALPGPAEPAASRTAQVLDAWVRRQGFQGSVLIARGEQPVLETAHGWAQLTPPVANGADRRYLLASVSKQFTAAAVLRLVDQGRLGLDDPVRQHLPELPRAWQAVTVRQLLAHTSGIPNHTEGSAFEQTKHRAWTPRELLASFASRPLDFTPGTRFRYSNSGYIVAGVLIEQLSGQRLDVFFREQFFEPLGMADTGLATGEQAVARLAAGYRRQPGTAADPSPAAHGAAALQAPAPLHLSVPYAAGALYGTARDLWTWQRALYGGRVLSPAGLREMTTVQHGGYALGLAVSEARPGQARRLMHAGGIDGFSSYLLHEPETGLTVALLANLEGLRLERMAHQLADAAGRRPVLLPDERRPVTLPAASLTALTGAYERPGEPGTFWVALSEGQLWARAGNEAWRLLQAQASAPDTPLFYAPAIDAELRFHRDASGQAVALEPLSDNGMATPRWLRVARPLPSIAGQTLYLRGGPNQWGTQDPLQHDGAGRYRLQISWPAGEHPFKLASADWQAVDLGATDDQPALDTATAPSGTARLAAVGGNLSLRLARASRCAIELDVRDPVQPRLRWDCAAGTTAGNTADNTQGTTPPR